MEKASIVPVCIGSLVLFWPKLNCRDFDVHA